MMDEHLHDDIRRSGTVDGAVHTDPGMHRDTIERVFAASWQLAVGTLPERRVEPLTLLPGALDEPLVITRDHHGAERVLSNVCTHRGALLAEEPSDAAALRCRYHGRRFELDGRLRTCPGFEDAEDFPRPEDHLACPASGQAGPLRFVSLDPAVPFDTWAAPLRASLAEFDGEELRYDPRGTHHFDLEASWALYCENYLEGFHVPFVHPGLNAALDFQRYRTELLPLAVRQLGFASGGEPRLARATEPGQVADYLWLYPNLMVNVYAWGISVNVVEPRGAGRCRVRYLRWVARPEHLGVGAGGDLGQVEREDQEVVLSVQRGMRSRLYPGGRFAPRHETGAHHFQRLLAADLRGDGAASAGLPAGA